MLFNPQNKQKQQSRSQRETQGRSNKQGKAIGDQLAGDDITPNNDHRTGELQIGETSSFFQDASSR